MNIQMMDLKMTKLALLSLFLTVSSIISSPAMAEIETLTYLVTDHLGSPILARDEQGATVWEEDYSPWGDRLVDSVANPADVGFTGHFEQPELGLTYAEARWYDADAGRFLSADPVDYMKGGSNHFNRYVYTYNNPIKYVDPDGEMTRNMPGSRSAFGACLECTVSGGGRARFNVVPPQSSASSSKPLAPLNKTPWAKEGQSGNGNVQSSSTLPKQSVEPAIQQISPKNLIPTQTKNEISGSQVKRIKKDMEKNGFDKNQPIDAVKNGNGRLEIQDGHHRVEAAKKAKIDKVPVRVWGD